MLQVQRSMSRSQGHQPWCHIKGNHYGLIECACQINMKPISLSIQKLWQRLKLTTNRQTDTQDKGNMPPIYRCVGLKIMLPKGEAR